VTPAETLDQALIDAELAQARAEVAFLRLQTIADAASEAVQFSREALAAATAAVEAARRLIELHHLPSG
jgi:hypothetical protein